MTAHLRRLARQFQSFLLYCFRDPRFQDFIMWPVAKRFPGLAYSEIVTIDDGLHMRVWLSYLDMVNRILLYYSRHLKLAWEPCTARLFKHLVGDSKNVVIAGANIGYYVLLAAKNSRARVHAFEPIPGIRKDCLTNIALNGFAIPVRAEALSENDGIARMSAEGGDSKLIGKQDHKAGSINVKTLTLDSYCKNENFLPDLMLLDVEGFEMSIFKGASQTLKDANCLIIFEMNFKELRRSGIPLSRIIDLLSSHGYHTYIIKDDYSHQRLYSTDLKTVLIPFSEEHCRDFPYEFVNCLATKAPIDKVLRSGIL